MESPGICESDLDEYLSQLPKWKIRLAAAIFGFQETEK